MEENRHNLLSLMNDGEEKPSIKRHKTRNVLKLPCNNCVWIKQLKIDEEDFENIKDIIKLKMSDGTSIEKAVSNVTTSDPFFTSKYRITSLTLRDNGDAATFWYDQPHLPNSLCNVDAVRSVYIEGTQIETLFSENTDRNHRREISVHELSLVSMPRLRCLSFNLVSFPNLQSLFLKSLPRLPCLPSNIGSFAKLKKLQLIKLPIDSLPKSLSSLGESLETLVIRYCEDLTHLPKEFGQLHSLKALEIFGTPIRELPESFGNLHSLQHLEMEFHHLTKLPPSFDNLTSLWTLNPGSDAFNFPVPHLPHLKKLETSVYNLQHFDQGRTVKHFMFDYFGDNTTETRLVHSGLINERVWNRQIPLAIKSKGGTQEYKLLTSSFPSFPKLTRFRLACGMGQNFTIYFDEIPGLKQLEHLDLIGFALLKSAQSLQDPAPVLNLKSISLCDIKGDLELLSGIRAPCLEMLHVEDCSSMDDVMFGHLCTNWFPHLKNLQSLKIIHCSISNIQPEHVQHLGKTNICSMDLQDNPILDGSKNELEKKLLPLVQNCQYLSDFGGIRVPRSVLHHLCLNFIRCHVLEGQRICSKALWALIFENAMTRVNCDTLRCRVEWELCQPGVIYVLLKDRAATELYS
ncbi:leucine rich repeat LRR-containing protein [Nitzschia inconspicua]|uniref:Leucine rich repeat LRR-containing protein n=1 Tax=Nitzschia inconspicua TaxID=303405 RepID=A0A9K3PKF3_9STRA|nr:leucine rich repeat LRR-containing protein [Nitzschia inconspicua]